MSEQPCDDRTRMSVQNKFLRKFFYENSGFVDDLAIFAELGNQDLAKKVGITQADQIAVV